MIILTKQAAEKIDKLLESLLNFKRSYPNTNTAIDDFILSESNNYKQSDKDELKKLLYLIMVEQRKTWIPEVIRGTTNFVVIDNGEPIKDLLSAGGFTAIWKERDEERIVSRNRYRWTNFLVILGILVTYGVSECSGLLKDRHQVQQEKLSKDSCKVLQVDLTKKDEPKISSKDTPKVFKQKR